jgi:hypothetical protein
MTPQKNLDQRNLAERRPQPGDISSRSVASIMVYAVFSHDSETEDADLGRDDRVRVHALGARLKRILLSSDWCASAVKDAASDALGAPQTLSRCEVWPRSCIAGHLNSQIAEWPDSWRTGHGVHNRPEPSETIAPSRMSLARSTCAAEITATSRHDPRKCAQAGLPVLPHSDQHPNHGCTSATG